MTDEPVNPFLRLADQQMVAATKAKHRRREVKIARSEKDAPMKLSAQEQAQADRVKLMQLYRAASNAEFAERIKGPNGENWKSLQNLLRIVAIDNPDALLAYVRNQKWLMEGDLKTRQDTLSLIAAHLIMVRQINGYPPFDDSLPDEEPTLFEILRRELKVLT